MVSAGKWWFLLFIMDLVAFFLSWVDWISCRLPIMTLEQIVIITHTSISFWRVYFDMNVNDLGF